MMWKDRFCSMLPRQVGLGAAAPDADVFTRVGFRTSQRNGGLLQEIQQVVSTAAQVRAHARSQGGSRQARTVLITRVV